uniref:Uncharacterized protein n=1 Tax=Myotis myotis TaxID=51298 RepID=A0A7J7VWW6_MYOMY|nr:hypothetical protein mMyoMyo1_001728 [Myotis myotis]
MQQNSETSWKEQKLSVSTEEQSCHSCEETRPEDPREKVSGFCKPKSQGVWFQRQEPSVDFQNTYIWTLNTHLLLKKCEQNKETLLSTKNVT